jgi:hypothetical protein
MNKALIVLLMSVSVSACTPMSVLSGLIPGSKPGISVDAQVGKDNTKQTGVGLQGDRGDITNSTVSKNATGVAIGGTTSNTTAEFIDTNVIAETQNTIKADNSTIGITNQITNIPPWVLILLVLGWVLPTPLQIFKAFVEWREKRKLFHVSL